MVERVGNRRRGRAWRLTAVVQLVSCKGQRAVVFTIRCPSPVSVDVVATELRQWASVETRGGLDEGYP